jgi:hypothetical protein
VSRSTLTSARRAALTVLAGGHHEDRPVYESNVTGGAGPGGRRTVYWQSLKWLVDEGLAEVFDGVERQVTLTDAGRQRIEELGL